MPGRKEVCQPKLLENKKRSIHITEVRYTPVLEALIIEGKQSNGKPAFGEYWEISKADELIAKREIRKIFTEEGYPHTGKLWYIETLK